jgi:DNA-binding transcriptional LysR family regulator
MNVSVDQIRAFVTAAATKNFTRAASTLCLSQPALTMRIRQLEENLRLRVFDRHTRSVQLTRVGRELLPVFTRLLSQFDSAIAGAKDLASLRQGSVRVAALPSVAASCLPPVVSKFRAEHPRIAFVLRDAVNSKVCEMVKSEEVDLGIVHREQSMEDFDAVDLFEDRLHAVYPAGHPLEAARILTVAMLSRYPLVLMDHQTSVRALVDRALVLANRPSSPACEATYITTAVAMVRAGLGVAVLPSTGLELSLHPEVRSAPIADRNLVRNVAVITRQGMSLSPPAALFLQMLRGRFAARPAASNKSR